MAEKQVVRKGTKWRRVTPKRLYSWVRKGDRVTVTDGRKVEYSVDGEYGPERIEWEDRADFLRDFEPAEEAPDAR